MKKVKLCEIALVKGGKRLPKGTNLVSTPNNHPYIRVRDLNDNKILELNSSYEYVDDETQKTISKYTVEKGDIVLSIVGTIGLIGIVGESLNGANLTENCVKLTSLQGVDKDYLYYFLKSAEGQQEIKKGIVGAVQAKLPIKNIQAIELELPDIETQLKIVSILKALDDKIALNNKINDNLEQQTQALYQKYFPETDNAGKLADLCDFSKDKIAVSELNVKNYFSTENMLPDKKGTTEAANLPAVEQTTACHIGNVLVSNIRPYFKKILYCHCEGGCSTDVLCFVPKILELSAYLYCTLYADKFFDFMVAGSKGTKMPRGDKKQIMTYSVCLPSENELKNFNAAVLPMFQLIESNRRENARLSLLRDTLLPKLMAGEI